MMAIVIICIVFFNAMFMRSFITLSPYMDLMHDNLSQLMMCVIINTEYPKERVGQTVHAHKFDNLIISIS